MDNILDWAPKLAKAFTDPMPGNTTDYGMATIALLVYGLSLYLLLREF